MKLVLQKILKCKKTGLPTFNLDNIDSSTAIINHQPVFVVGTGRSGTHFISKIMEMDNIFLSVHTDSMNLISDSFTGYCIWNNLPVDIEPYRDYRYRLIAYASQCKKVYFESNAYLSLLSRHLYKWFNSKIVLLIRDPVDVVNSHFVKGWYKETPKRIDLRKAPGFLPDMNANHFFGRIMPNGQDYIHWQKLTRIGKIAWWWNTLNLNVYNQLRKLPEPSYKILKLEEFDYERYINLHSWSGGKKLMLPKQFDKLRESRPGKGKRKRSLSSWSKQEWKEFLTQTEEARGLFCYSVDRK